MIYRVVLCLTLASISIAAFADWPRFRGPNGAGISDTTTIPTEWTDEDYNWRIDLPGEGHGSPVVVGNNIFLLCGDPFTAARRVVCINSDDGKIRWVKSFKSKLHYIHRLNNYASSTPAADNDGVVTIWTTPKTFVVTALNNDGELLWQRDLGEYKSAWGGSPSPIIVDDMVIIQNDQMNPEFMKNFLPEGVPVTEAGHSYAVALDRSTGETRWMIDRESIIASYATPCIRELSNGEKELVIVGAYNGMTGIDVKTGKVNWLAEDTFPNRTVMSPVLAGELIVGSSGLGTVGDRLVAVRPPDEKNDSAEVAYRIKKSIPLVPTAVYKDGLIFLTSENGAVSCVDAETGEYVWRERTGGKFLGSPILVDGRLFCTDRRGDIFVLAAGKTFELLARNSLGDDSYATPAVANGSLYIRTLTQLMSIGGEK